MFNSFQTQALAEHVVSVPSRGLLSRAAANPGGLFRHFVGAVSHSAEVSRINAMAIGFGLLAALNMNAQGVSNSIHGVTLNPPLSWSQTLIRLMPEYLFLLGIAGLLIYKSSVIRRMRAFDRALKNFDARRPSGSHALEVYWKPIRTRYKQMLRAEINVDAALEDVYESQRPWMRALFIGGKMSLEDMRIGPKAIRALVSYLHALNINGDLEGVAKDAVRGMRGSFRVRMSKRSAVDLLSRAKEMYFAHADYRLGGRLNGTPPEADILRAA